MQPTPGSLCRYGKDDVLVWLEVSEGHVECLVHAQPIVNHWGSPHTLWALRGHLTILHHTGQCGLVKVRDECTTIMDFAGRPYPAQYASYTCRRLCVVVVVVVVMVTHPSTIQAQSCLASDFPGDGWFGHKQGLVLYCIIKTRTTTIFVKCV